jgi:hypothetical protein
VICPSGGLSMGVSSPLCKNIPVFTHPKSRLELFISRPTERGVSRSSRTLGAGCDGRGSVLRAMGSQGGFRLVSDVRHADEGRLQRTAKSCGPDAPTLASSQRMLCRPNRARTKRYPLMTVAKEPGHRGERDISRKTTRVRECRAFRCTRCYSCAFYQYKVHTRPRVQRAPGIPHALCFLGESFMHNSGASHRAAGSRTHVWICRHCEQRSDEAIHANPWPPEATGGFLESKEHKIQISSRRR